MNDHTSETWTEEDQAASEPDFYGKWTAFTSEEPKRDRIILLACVGGEMCTGYLALNSGKIISDTPGEPEGYYTHWCAITPPTS